MPCFTYSQRVREKEHESISRFGSGCLLFCRWLGLSGRAIHRGIQPLASAKLLIRTGQVRQPSNRQRLQRQFDLMTSSAIAGASHETRSFFVLMAEPFIFTGSMEDVTLLPNYLAGVGAGRTPEFIEMKQVGHGCWSGSARLAGR